MDKYEIQVIVINAKGETVEYTMVDAMMTLEQAIKASNLMFDVYNTSLI